MVVRTKNSVYEVAEGRVRLISGTPSKHLPYEQWVIAEVTGYPEQEIKVGQPLLIHYNDEQVRITTDVVSCN
jgi:hypothetical protein